jgi:hypothetical protein
MHTSRHINIVEFRREGCMPIDLSNLLLMLLIAAASVVFGVMSGRAKAARMRELAQDLKEGKPRGWAVVFVVVAIFLVAALTR